jgi:hypothetical protein
MSKRFNKLGIKQTIQKHWMDYVVKMMLAGIQPKEIRAELNDYLATQLQSGGTGDRGQKTYGMAIGILASWYSPDKELESFRDAALDLIRSENPKNWLPFHWAIISASYPFWFNVSRQVGKLFKLQDQITQAQVFSRLKEQYGDRETVARNARYTIRSFIAWGVLKDSGRRGHYEKSGEITIDNSNTVALLYESALHTTVEGRSDLELIQANPGFFPFQLPSFSGEYISQQSNAINVEMYGLDKELLKLLKSKE